ncbi:hypothetical protein HPB50_004026 [Hyalomma asiaticum]|uniref:Uncharacterized protein n=1 Tax=Hyalomma asiaticum TaxID=266040 RepID=A0ACB7SSV4_HYAAI|nr:hypothetical protein HPB50_004026 [Hyalomma asiaticum]
MPSTVTVEGMEVSAETFDGPGWATAMGRRSKKTPPSEEPTAGIVVPNNQPRGFREPKKSQSTLNRVSQSRTRPATVPQQQQPHNGTWASTVEGASQSTSGSPLLNDKIETLANTLANFIETFKAYTEKADQGFARLEMLAAGPAAAVAPQCRNVDKSAVTGYRVARPTLHPEENKTRVVATLIRKDIMFAERDTHAYKQGQETVLVEILPHRTVKRSIFVLNIYSPPSDKKKDFKRLLTSAKAANEAPKVVETDASIQAMDFHLASLLQKKHDLKEAWNKNKLNRHLRAEIAELGREIESHAKKLCAQQWNNACDEADGKIRRGSKWGLLKHLMADSDKPTKGGAKLQIERAKAGHNTEASKRLEKSTNNFSRGIARIANKRAGLLEDNIMKTYHAFLSTSTKTLEQLGPHNTAEEIFEAQRTAQITRLSTTQAGHRILRDADIRPIFQPEEKTKLTNDVRKHIKVEQIPRNVHPTLNEGRRRDRARALINNTRKAQNARPLRRRGPL